MTTRRVRILVNKRSGFMWSFQAVQKAFDRYWDIPENDLSYQFCKDAADGREKARRVAEQEFDTLLVVGGDGTISTTGSALIGSDTTLGVIPMGSGNGFARHFNISLKPEEAVKELAEGTVTRIDVGTVNDQPFLVTCSMAWDAALVESFEKSPVRGVLPYVFAGVYEFFEYEPQRITAVCDGDEQLDFPAPMVFTVANLTQYGGGAMIAPEAKHNDGMLDLVVARRQDVPALVSQLTKLFNGSADKIPELVYRRFKELTITREHAAPIQIDGELIEAGTDLTVSVKPSSLNVLAPKA